MRTTIVPCLLALTLASCGAGAKDSTKDFKGAERGVAATVEALETAARDDKPGDACTKLFSTGLLAAIKAKGKNCQSAVKDAFKDADTVDLTVDDVAIDGAKATVAVTSGTGSHKKRDRLGLERAGTGWRISSLQS